MNEEQLFKKLKLEPEFRLPPSFPGKVSLVIQKKTGRLGMIRFYASSAIAILMTFVVGYSLVRLVSTDAAQLFLSALMEYKWVLITIVVCFLCILYCDQKLVKKAG